MATYGKTWWGQQWLNALSKIDNSNRLPRGKTYANKGLVQGVEINKNTISAKVQGSSSRPYKVSVIVTEFTISEKEKLILEILDNPKILASLLNRDLPQELAQFSEKNRISLFPSSWRDFPMHCSCPDYAVPCKHLAALIYIISNEIDKNPFLIFQLHGLNILEVLNARFDTGTSSNLKVAKYVDFFEKTPPKSKINDAVFDSLNFARIDYISENLLKILKPSPIFAEKDFKKTLEKAYKSTKKSNYTDFFKKPFEDFNDRNEIVFHVNEIATLENIVLISSDGEEVEELSTDSFEKFVVTIASLGMESFGQMSDSIRLIKTCLQFSENLISKGAIVPQLLCSDSNEHFIRWLPALNDENVKIAFEQLAEAVPSELVQLKTKKATLFQTQKEQLLTLTSLFISLYVKSFTTFLGVFYRGKVTFERWENFFFQQNTETFSAFGDKELPAIIQSWLNNLFISQKEFTPVLQVEEEEEEGVFTMDVLIKNKEDKKAPIRLKKIISEKQYEKIRFDVLQDLLQLSAHFPELDTYLQKKAVNKMAFSGDEFVPVLLQILPVLQLFGIQILLPKALKHWVRPQASGVIKAKKADGSKSFMQLEEMLTFNWQVAVGDELISWEDFMKLTKGVAGLVKIRDKYILINDDELAKLKKQLENPPILSGVDLLKTALSEDYQGSKVGLSKEVIDLLKQFSNADEENLPKNLNAELRPYQLRGYHWLLKNTRLGFGSLIADDMGLGKTIQVITLLLKFKQEGAFAKEKGLIIVPTTLLTNWQKEIERFAPELQYEAYHGTKRKLDFSDKSKATDLVITTYGTVRSDAAIFKKTNWHCIIIDEAQNIKNPDTEQTKALKQLKGKVKIAMSGTPVENRLSEFWSIMDFTNRGYLGNLTKFTKEFSKPIQAEHDLDKLTVFKKITSPFLLRRVKTDKTIIKDLPDKIENNHYVSLTKSQAAVYESVVSQSIKDIKENEGIARKGLVLKLMTALKQIGNHPYQYLKDGTKTIEESGKTQLLLELVEQIMESNEKVLIFTQYREMGDLLTEFIRQKIGIVPMFLHGGVSRKERDKLVERFQKNRTDSIFILSLKAGGTGLNLTQGNHVIHYDLWWNPAVENQATDRAFRIGQTKNVMVYRLINQGTMEEKIDNMIQSKKNLADLSIENGESWIGDLTNDELLNLVTLTK